jgi:hypothetical protein
MSACKSRDRLRALSIVTAAPPVAQLDRAPGFEPGCREFESLRAGHISKRLRWGAFCYVGSEKGSNSRVRVERSETTEAKPTLISPGGPFHARLPMNYSLVFGVLQVSNRALIQPG